MKILRVKESFPHRPTRDFTNKQTNGPLAVDSLAKLAIQNLNILNQRPIISPEKFDWGYTVI